MPFPITINPFASSFSLIPDKVVAYGKGGTKALRFTLVLYTGDVPPREVLSVPGLVVYKGQVSVPKRTALIGGKTQYFDCLALGPDFEKLLTRAVCRWRCDFTEVQFPPTGEQL